MCSYLKILFFGLIAFFWTSPNVNIAPEVVEAWKVVKNSGDAELAKLATNLHELDLERKVKAQLDKADEFANTHMKGVADEVIEEIDERLRNKIRSTLSKNQADELIAQLEINSILKKAFDDNLGLVEAWKVLDDLNSGLKTDIPTLTKLSDDLKLNPDLETFLKADASNLNVWENVRYLRDHTHDIDFLTWNKTFQDWSSGNGKKLYEHIFQGTTGGTNGISGVHHVDALTTKVSGFDIGDIIIRPGTKVSKANGFYEAEIEFWNGTTWITKTENGIPVKNGFFPDSWQHSQIMEEVALARSKVSVGDWLSPIPPKTSSNAYVKTLSNGQKVTFYIGQATSGAPSTVGMYTISVFPIF